MTPAVWDVQQLADQAEEDRDRYFEALVRLENRAAIDPETITAQFVRSFIAEVLA